MDLVAEQRMERQGSIVNANLWKTCLCGSSDSRLLTFVANLSISIGIFWSSAPVIGWSHYSLEGALISCSIEWHERTASVMSYNILIALFVYLLPLGIFCFTSARVYYLVRISSRKFVIIYQLLI